MFEVTINLSFKLADYDYENDSNQYPCAQPG